MAEDPPNPFQCPEFLRLQKAWYGRLKEEGFRDLEEEDLFGHNEGLKFRGYADDDFRSAPIRKAMLPEDGLTAFVPPLTNNESIQLGALGSEYYERCGQFLHDAESPWCPRGHRDRSIWRLHSEGWTVRRIATHLRCSKNTVQKRVAHYRTLMRLWWSDCEEERAEEQKNRLIAEGFPLMSEDDE